MQHQNDAELAKSRMLYALIGALSAELLLILFLWNALAELLYFGVFHPMVVILTALSISLFAVGILSYRKFPRIYRYATYGALFFSGLSLWSWFNLFTVAIAAPTILASVFALASNHVKQSPLAE